MIIESRLPQKPLSEEAYLFRLSPLRRHRPQCQAPSSTASELSFVTASQLSSAAIFYFCILVLQLRLLHVKVLPWVFGPFFTQHDASTSSPVAPQQPPSWFYYVAHFHESTTTQLDISVISEVHSLQHCSMLFCTSLCSHQTPAFTLCTFLAELDFYNSSLIGTPLLLLSE